MKIYHIYYALFALLIFSCSSNDDVVAEDPIVGTWLMVSDNRVEGGQITTTNFNECNAQTNYTFSSNNEYSWEVWDFNGQGDCGEVQGTFVENGRWENKGNGVYEISGDYTYSDVDYGFNTVLQEIEFIDDNTVHVIEGDKNAEVYYFIEWKRK